MDKFNPTNKNIALESRDWRPFSSLTISLLSGAVMGFYLIPTSLLALWGQGPCLSCTSLTSQCTVSSTSRCQCILLRECQVRSHVIHLSRIIHSAPVPLISSSSFTTKPSVDFFCMKHKKNIRKHIRTEIQTILK